MRVNLLLLIAVLARATALRRCSPPRAGLSDLARADLHQPATRRAPACPPGYRLGAEALRDAPSFQCSTLYAVGGLYGNPYALAAIQERAEQEAATLVFNGDFNFFNAEPCWWRHLNEEVRGGERQIAMAGNVEIEMAKAGAYTGCGCGYPEYVDRGVVERSDRIVEALRRSAHEADASELLEWIRGLPRALVAEMPTDGGGVARVGIVHGDVDSSAGWQLGVEAMEPPDDTLRQRLGCADPHAPARYMPTTPRERVLGWCETAGVSGLLCTHTCLPFGQILSGEASPPGPRGDATAAVFNNGAAGMPNFAGERGTGLVTRVSSDPAPPADSLYGGVVDGLRFDAVRIHYDHEAWAARVSERWPEGSDVHRSYHARMQGGPAAFAVANAAREGVALPADP